MEKQQDGWKLTNPDLRKWLDEHPIRKVEKESGYPGEDTKHLRIGIICENGCAGREKNRTN